MDPDNILSTNSRIIQRAQQLLSEKQIDRISIYNGGSFFELPQQIVSKLAEVTKGKIAEIESRPEFVTRDSLEGVLSKLQPSMLVVRIGLESAFEHIRNGVLNKGIPDAEISRLLKLRRKLKRESSLLSFISYVLFGIEGVSEESIRESVTKFNREFDGVIAIKYRRYKPTMPDPVRTSESLLEFLRQSCLEVDLADSPVWEVEVKM